MLTPISISAQLHLCRQSGHPVLECVNKDKAKVQIVKNKNKSGGAKQAGSVHKRLRRIPVPNRGKQRAGQKAARSCMSPLTV